MNDMRKLMEAVKLNEGGTMPTIKAVQAWQVVDEMGETVFHTKVKDAIIDYAESYAEANTESTFGEDHQAAWRKQFVIGKKRARNIVTKSKK